MTPDDERCPHLLTFTTRRCEGKAGHAGACWISWYTSTADGDSVPPDVAIAIKLGKLPGHNSL